MEYVNIVQQIVREASKKDFLKAIVLAETVFGVAFLICSFVVAGTANAGFNCVLTAFLNLAIAAGCYHVLIKSKAPIAIGFLIGSSAIMLPLNLMTAIFWAQLSHCKHISSSLAGYSCDNTTAYGAVSAFAVLLLLSQSVFTASLILWRDEFILEANAYEGISTGPQDPVVGSYKHGTRSLNPQFVYEAPTAGLYAHQAAASNDV